jgi:hypothetical protein
MALFNFFSLSSLSTNFLTSSGSDGRPFSKLPTQKGIIPKFYDFSSFGSTLLRSRRKTTVSLRTCRPISALFNLVSQNNIISCSRTGYRGNKTKEGIPILSAMHTEKKDSERAKGAVGAVKGQLVLQLV